MKTLKELIITSLAEVPNMPRHIRSLEEAKARTCRLCPDTDDCWSCGETPTKWWEIESETERHVAMLHIREQTELIVDNISEMVNDPTGAFTLAPSQDDLMAALKIRNSLKKFAKDLTIEESMLKFINDPIH